MKMTSLYRKKTILRFSTSSKSVLFPSLETDTIMRYSMVIIQRSVSSESLVGIWLNTCQDSIMLNIKSLGAHSRIY